jgi:hypothetical protein
MNEPIQQHWKESQMLGFDCVSFANGKVVMLNYSYFLEGATRKPIEYRLHPLCDTTIESILQYYTDPWAVIEPLYSEVPVEKGVILYGEGAMGNEGFIARLDDNRNYEWGIFMTFSNPVMQVIRAENDLVAKTDFFELIIPLASPERIKIGRVIEFGKD